MMLNDFESQKYAIFGEAILQFLFTGFSFSRDKLLMGSLVYA